MQPDTYVFTVITKETSGYFRLLDSAKKWGWLLHTHFVTPPLGGVEESYHSFIAAKHLEIYEILRDKTHASTFLYLDGWDTAFIGPPIKNAFRQRYELGFSGSKDCYPEKGYAKFFDQRGGYHPYLNTGVIWGSRVEYLRRCPITKVLDQLAWTREYVRDPAGLFIDQYCDYVVTLFGENNPAGWQLNGNRWNFLPTAKQPLIVHAAGKCGMPPWFEN